MAPRFSVLIAVYNGESFIARAIESVLAQTYPAHEIIVINDGSKDNTEEVLKGFGQRIRFRTIPNGGVANARNQGISMATGDWIAFLDADDVWKKEKLQVHREYSLQFPDVGFSCCNYVVYNSYLKREVEHFEVLKGHQVAFNSSIDGDKALKLLAELNFVGTASTVVIKKDVLDCVGLFNTNYKQAEDYELWMRAAMVTNFTVLSQVLVEKKIHATNLTNDIYEMYFFQEMVMIAFMSKYGEYIDNHQLKPVFLDTLSRVDLKLADLSFNAGRVRESFELFWLSFSIHKTPGTFLRMLFGVAKKSIRLLSFDIISRKNLRRFFRF